MLHLDPTDQALLAGAEGPAAAMAMRIVVESARMLDAERLLSIASTHIDGCLYHGDSGTAFAERLVAEGGAVRVPTTLNVGALDLLHPDRERLDPERRTMARRLMAAYQALGCRPTWTCAPYQAGHRPRLGEDVAWGESNAVVFCNSVLGARTNRYGDFLDICAALAGRAPQVGLHRPENRRARLVVDVHGLRPELLAEETFYPVLGAWLGAEAGDVVAVIDGLPAPVVTEDRLKALGAAAASTGAVGLFHVTGITPEAPTLEAALHHQPPDRVIRLTPAMLRASRDRLSTSRIGTGGRIDAVAIGSPHLSHDEVDALERRLAGRRCAVPLYACTGRHVIQALDAAGRRKGLEAAGVVLVVDTCIVVTPILPPQGGVLLTNSGKFAHYAPANTGHETVFGNLSDCVESAVAGTLRRDEALWT